MGLGVLMEDVWGIFDPAAFKVIWGSCVALAIFQKYDFPEIRFSKRCLSYTYDPFSTKFL